MKLRHLVWILPVSSWVVRNHSDGFFPPGRHYAFWALVMLAFVIRFLKWFGSKLDAAGPAPVNDDGLEAFATRQEK